ncbi:MAG: tetratricopeptide repeat protein [Phycisphaerales bacterium]|jgi:tetratricopeptide (TPR) repeat protein|nr:hypothetical protein [Phycisphaeraceae bacterium]
MIDQRRVSIPGRVVVAAAMALVALAGTGVGVATAQTKGAAEAAAAVAAEAGSRASTLTLEQATAIAMVRVASVDLRVNPSPGIDDYRLALQVLRQAAALDPKNQDILRLAIDAADQAGDAGAAEGLTRELLKIAPDDEPAQLRLISANISRLQSVTARLAAYDNLLGPRGQSLPVAVRSRLAMDAALLHRERGEIEAFASRLSMAASLDSTNREAASLAYTFFAQRSRDASGRLELLVNLLRADPLDPRTHATLARELLEVGAAEPAVRFYANARMLSERRLETVDTALRQEALIALWRSKGPAAMMRELLSDLKETRRQLDAAVKEAEDAGRPTDAMPKGTDARLRLESERLRMSAALAEGNETEVAASMVDMAASIEQLDRWSEAPETRPASISADEVARERVQWRVDGVWMRLLSGQQVDQAATLLEALSAAQGDDRPDEATLARLNAWLLFRRDKLEEARAALAALDATDPLASLGLTMLGEKAGDAKGAAAIYAQINDAMPASSIGALAGSRLARLREPGGPAVPPVPAQGQGPAKVGMGVPKWLDEMITTPRSLQGLTVEATNTRLASADPAMLRVRVRNLAPVAMGFGPDGPINSRLLLSPLIEAGDQRLDEIVSAMVLRLDRRLRLEPRQDLVADVWIDPGYTGWALEHTTGRRTTTRYRVLQGFRMSSGGATEPGPFSLSTNSPTYERSPITGAGAPGAIDVAALEAGIASTSPAVFIDALSLAALRLAIDSGDRVMPPADVERVIAALAIRYAQGDAGVRRAMLARLPTGRVVPALAALDSKIAEVAETDPGVIVLRLLTRVVSPDDPSLVAWLASEDAGVKASAETVQRRLREGVRSYATMDRFTLPDDRAGAAPARPSASPGTPSRP